MRFTHIDVNFDVTHLSTNPAHGCLTSMVGQELVYSTRYGLENIYLRDARGEFIVHILLD